MTFVALGRGAEIAVAVIAVPARSERWWGAQGAGAFRDGDRLAVSTVARVSDATVNDDWRGTLENRIPGRPLAAVGARARAVHPVTATAFWQSRRETRISRSAGVVRLGLRSAQADRRGGGRPVLRPRRPGPDRLAQRARHQRPAAR